MKSLLQQIPAGPALAAVVVIVGAAAALWVRARHPVIAERPAALPEPGETELSDAQRLAAERAAARAASEAEARRVTAISDRIEATAAAAEQAAAAGDLSGAARGLAEAVDAQRRLNARFPGSREASAPRAEQWEARRQTLLSAPLWNRVRALHATMGVALRRGDTATAGREATEAAGLVDLAQAEFPRSVLTDTRLARELDFLALCRGDLARVHALAREAEGGPVPQQLYALVMHANPSRDAGSAVAVTNVTWREANEFCTRLSWMLGRLARLPTERDHARAAKHTGIDEWLRPRGGDPALVAPICDHDAADAGPAVRFEAKTHRERGLGFGFVVEVE